MIPYDRGITMSKYIKSEPKPYAVVKNYEDGGVLVVDYFYTDTECKQFINEQEKPKIHDFWKWGIAQYD